MKALPKSQAHHGDAASRKRWGKMCRFLSFIALLQKRTCYLCPVAHEVKSRVVMKSYWNFEAIWVVLA